MNFTFSLDSFASRVMPDDYFLGEGSLYVSGERRAESGEHRYSALRAENGEQILKMEF